MLSGDDVVYFTSIEPTRHYLEEHATDVPWADVVRILLTTKNPKRKGDVFEIEKEDYYLLFTIKDHVLHVINAKRTR